MDRYCQNCGAKLDTYEEGFCEYCDKNSDPEEDIE